MKIDAVYRTFVAAVLLWNLMLLAVLVPDGFSRINLDRLLLVAVSFGLVALAWALPRLRPDARLARPRRLTP